ncbi:TIGR02302 family protein [Consotaella aegiceratis]|uniref:TIGR02302 family protein n=1 Tax=Consotaella aegiceratis TaxID=3097961 RepID=UPI002F3F999D
MINDARRPSRFRSRRLSWIRGGAYLSLAVERAWPTVLAAAGVVAVFLTLAWFGILYVLPAWARFVVLGLLAICLGIVLWRARGLSLPSPQQVDERVELESRLSHQPLLAQSDAVASDDPFAVALWREHQRRMAERLRNLTGGSPRTRTERLDPYGLRAVLALLLVTAFAFSFGSRGGRVADAFRPPEQGPIATARVDAWVTPPSYTGRAPIFLTGVDVGPPSGSIEVPQGSVLSVRVSDGTGAALRFTPAKGGEAVAIEPMPLDDKAVAGDAAAETDGGDQPQPSEYEYELADSGSIDLASRSGALGQWTFSVLPDDVPTIAFDGEPEEARNGALHLSYTVSDDYGVRQGGADIEVLDEHVGDDARPLVPAPEIRLAMPRRTRGEARARTSIDLTESPYAGAEVAMTLTAADDAGQIGRSEEKRFRLPARRFFNPLARAVVEQRQMLALDANAAPRVVDMLDAVTVRGDDFIERPADYLALRAVRERIANAANDDALRSAVDFLWEIALGIEDGDLSLAERRLRDARERLSEALENGASDEEIDRLMDELRQAMQDYMQAMAEAMKNLPPMTQDQLSNMQELRPQDLNQMLDQIEDLAKSGSKDAAQQLLSELQSMMDNLQAMRPDQMPRGNQQSPMQQQMNELGEMLRRQQELMDQTFQLGRRMEQQGQQGAQDQPGQQSRQGQQPGQGGEPMTAEEMQKLMEQLQAQQGQLQQDLEALQKRMEGMGMQPSDALGEAGEAMGNAEGALGQSDDGTAVTEQGRALEAMRRGGQQMMEQMQQAMQPGPGQPGNTGPGFARGPQGPSGRDPLGRPRARRGPEFGENVEVPDEIDIQRARQILDAIRERLGNALSPQLEREYLERLLKTP